MSFSKEHKKKKLVVMLSRFPFPLDKGDKLRAYYQLVEFSKNFEITLICTTDQRVSQNAIDEIRKYCQTIHIIKLSYLSILFNLFLNLLNGKPFQVGYFYSSKNKSYINSILKETQPDHIFCQLIRVSEYVKNYHNCPKTIDYMDALSKGIERRIEGANFLTKWFFKSEYRRLIDYERKIFEYFEYRLIISEQDRNYILHPDRNNILCIPNGVGPHFFESIDDVKKEYTLVFVGNLNYPPNIQAIHFLIEELLPICPSETTLLLSGANPHSSIEKLVKNAPNVTLTGWVDDIRTSYLKGKIFVAPMFIGTGLQNKLLEAMALGIPCITTSLANNAINGIDKKHLLVANNVLEFKDSILQLLNNDTIYNQVKDNCQLFVKENFNWENGTSQIIELIKK
jgi:glycosyltransferase involved in cell wall biosynthesis